MLLTAALLAFPQETRFLAGFFTGFHGFPVCFPRASCTQGLEEVPAEGPALLEILPEPLALLRPGVSTPWGHGLHGLHGWVWLREFAESARNPGIPVGGGDWKAMMRQWRGWLATAPKTDAPQLRRTKHGGNKVGMERRQGQLGLSAAVRMVSIEVSKGQTFIRWGS